MSDYKLHENLIDSGFDLLNWLADWWLLVVVLVGAVFAATMLTLASTGAFTSPPGKPCVTEKIATQTYSPQSESAEIVCTKR